MNWKKCNPISSVKLMGLITLIIVSGIGTMTAMSLQIHPVSGMVTANIAEGKYYRTLYGATPYIESFYHDGNPYVYNFIHYEGKSLNLTLTPKVLAIESIYLMRISRVYYSDDGSRGEYLSEAGRGWMKNPDQDVIKIAEYDMPANVVFLGVIDIPENDVANTGWWLVCFCAGMGYRGGPDNNPDGKVIIDIAVV
jgi:hypothetical protein